MMSENTDDPYVKLARASFTAYTLKGCTIDIPDGLPDEMLDRRAGVFVSLHENGDLRGCIGTIDPMRSCVAEEIICNAISACSEDPRFPVVSPDELDDIVCSVDVLTKPEPIEGQEKLDPRIYGVIVTRGWHRGVLLPDLEGVDTATDQIAIAKMKAGIPADASCDLQRFQVVRHV